MFLNNINSERQTEKKHIQINVKNPHPLSSHWQANIRILNIYLYYTVSQYFKLIFHVAQHYFAAAGPYMQESCMIRWQFLLILTQVDLIGFTFH